MKTSDTETRRLGAGAPVPASDVVGRDTALRDLLLVILIGTAALLAAGFLDIDRALGAWIDSRAGPYWLWLRELPAAFVIGTLGIVWFAWRRWAEHRRESAAHAKTLCELRTALDEVVAANEAKTRFLSNMSHELRTPLNAILGFSEVIRDAALGPTVSEKYRDYANDIHYSGQHLLAIVNDILDMGRMESGAETVQIGPVKAALIVKQIAQILGKRASDGGVELRLAVPSRLLVLAAEDRLRQALLNLVHNAIKFTPSGGAVTLSGMDEGETAFLRITDTGIGIAPEDLSTALAPFGQIDGALQRRYEGTGLGLPLAKRFIEAQGGTLSLTSEVGQGTQVTIALPLAPGR